MRAILINPFDKTIKDVTITHDFKDIQILCNFSIFNIVSPFWDTIHHHNNRMYIDDEGLYKPDQRYFKLHGNNYAGKALIVGIDEDENTSTSFELQDIKDFVTWLPDDHKETPYLEFEVLQDLGRLK
tara:strand:- start:44 stop:424 length:381 start_codon:yes stop_codon:yes gene_type:complete